MGRKQTDETKLKIAQSVKSWQSKLQETDPEKYFLYKKNQSEGTKKRYAGREVRRVEYLKTSDFGLLGWESKRDRIILDQEGKCNHCGHSEWRGVKLPLEIDHISGDRDDNSRDNLEAICGNCHSITPTFRAKNKKSVLRVSDEILIDALKSSVSIRQALIKVGLTPKGGNYIRMKKLKDLVDSENVCVSVIE